MDSPIFLYQRNMCIIKKVAELPAKDSSAAINIG